MTDATRRRYEQLQRLFHEPGRLSILSVLCGEPDGLTFPDLKDALGMTDGNLNRHLKTLADAGVVNAAKAFVDEKPRTTISLTEDGVARFEAYLDTLGQVLAEARRGRKMVARMGSSVRMAAT